MADKESGAKISIRGKGARLHSARLGGTRFIQIYAQANRIKPLLWADLHSIRADLHFSDINGIIFFHCQASDYPPPLPDQRPASRASKS